MWCIFITNWKHAWLLNFLYLYIVCIVLYMFLSLCYIYSSGEFETYFQICRSLEFKDKPDYIYLRQLFRKLFFRLGYTYDYVFDWSTTRIVSNGELWDNSELWSGKGGETSVEREIKWIRGVCKWE